MGFRCRIRRPSIIMSTARVRPTMRATRWLPPLPGIWPSVTRKRQQRIRGGQPDVAGHGQLEPDAHRILFHGADHRFGTALRRSDVPGKVRHAIPLDLRKAFTSPPEV